MGQTEDKFTAVYLMVRESELAPEDAGSFDGALERQKAQILAFLKEKSGGSMEAHVEFYTRRGQLLTDIERNRVARLVVMDVDRLGATQEDLDGLLFELKMSGIELLQVNE